MVQSLRFTISEPARREVLDRLLALNNVRYEEEVKAGLHEKKKAGKSKVSRARTEGNSSAAGQLQLA